MPIYEYKCPKCSKEFEELVFGDESPACPDCGEICIERLLSCSCLLMLAPTRAGLTVSYLSSGRFRRAGCSGVTCATSQ